MSARQRLAVVFVLAATSACKQEPIPRPEAAPAQEASPSVQEPIRPEVAAQLDSGNAALRADDFAGALAHYTKATELAPELAAAWFGVFMAQEALGNAHAAQEALARTRALEPGANLAHPSAGDTAR